MVNMVNDTDIAWCAGFFDGEGCTHKTGPYALRLTVVQSDRSVLEKFKAVFPDGKIYGPYNHSIGHFGQKDIFRFEASTKVADAALTAMWPYLSQPKKDQATKAGFGGPRWGNGVPLE